MSRVHPYSLLPLRRVKEGVTLIADDGFTCIPDHAQRKVYRDRAKHYGEVWGFNEGRMLREPMNSRSRLYVKCDHGRHYLDGQECDAGQHGMKQPHYVGFWIKGEQPPKEVK